MNESEYPAEVVEACIAAVQTAFEELCRTPVASGEPHRTADAPDAGWVIAEIGLRRAIPGRLFLAFPQPVLEALADRYLPADEPRTTELVADTAGEFANVVAGQVKTSLKGTAYHFNLSTPNVGLSAPAGDSLAIPFQSEVGPFTMYLHLPACAE